MHAFRINVDPRHYQIAVLLTLTACGVTLLDFPVRLVDAAVIVLAAQLTQYLGSRCVGTGFDPKSALISALSLTLLLRSDSLLLLAAAAVIAIAGKFLLRVNGKHIFNPANSAIVLLMLLSDRAWISTGQWGSTAITAFALACCGFLVLTRARRAETTLAFLGMYVLLLFGRALWLGDPLSIPLHQLQSGALLIFAFFMISDPKTAPDAAVGRLAYGSVVALAGFAIQFAYFKPYGPLLALFLCAPLVPAIDYALRGRRYRWNATSTKILFSPLKEPSHADTDPVDHGRHHVLH